MPGQEELKRVQAHCQQLRGILPEGWLVWPMEQDSGLGILVENAFSTKSLEYKDWQVATIEQVTADALGENEKIKRAPEQIPPSFSSMSPMLTVLRETLLEIKAIRSLLEAKKL